MRLLLIALVVSFGVALFLDRLPRLRAGLRRLADRRTREMPPLPNALRMAATLDAHVASAVVIRDRAAEFLSRAGAAADPWFLTEIDGVIEDLATTAALSRELGLQLAADREVRGASADLTGLMRRITALDDDMDTALTGLREVWGELIEVLAASTGTNSADAARHRLAELRRRLAAEREARELAPADWT